VPAAQCSCASTHRCAWACAFTVGVAFCQTIPTYKWAKDKLHAGKDIYTACMHATHTSHHHALCTIIPGEDGYCLRLCVQPGQARQTLCSMQLDRWNRPLNRQLPPSHW